MDDCASQQLRDSMDDVAYSAFIKQRLFDHAGATAGADQDTRSSREQAMDWAQWLAEEYLPQGRVLRFLATTVSLFALGCVLLSSMPATYITAPAGGALMGGGGFWIFTGSEMAFLLVSVCFYMICLVDISVIISTENPLKRQLIWIILCINAEAAITYSMLCWDYMPLFADAQGRPLYALRWLMWACSTSSLIFMISELANEEKIPWLTVVASNVGGLFLGFLSKFSPHLGWILFAAACVTYVPTAWGMYRLFTTGIRKLISKESTMYYQALAYATVVLWTSFPCVYVVSALQLISPELEATLYALLDLAAKGAYSLALLRSNYYSIDQLDDVKRLGSEEILCKALATTREIELAGRILLTAKSEAGAVKQLHRSFLSHMSHELRTPLNHMIGFNELLIEDTGLSSMQRAYITAALNSAKGLLSMIDNILEYSRLEGSVIPLDAIDFDLYDMLDDVVDALRKQAVFYGVDVVYRLDLKGISTSRMVGDPHRLSQMIKHLVDNAIKSYDGQRRGDGYNGSTVSAVEIRVQFANKRLWNRKGDPRADIGMAKWSEASLREGVQVGTLTIEVEDRGKGIPEREMKKLFSPFGQVESRGKSDGIGLGLAIVKQLADAMGGKTSCTSAEGVGSIFFINNLTLPVSSKQSSHMEHDRMEEASVLIVAKPPLLAGLTHQLQSLWNAPETVDASCPEEFKEWLAAAAGRASLSDEEKAAVADRRARTGVSDALIIDAQLLPPAELAKLPYKRIITLSPPRQVKEASTSITVGEDLMRPVTRRTLREVLTVATERDAAGQLKAGSQHQQQQQEQDEGHARQGNSPFLVLVVDDNKVNQKVVGAILRRLGVPFDTANDGVEAIEQICKTRYDLVLMDLSMPRMGGLEATRIVRTIEKSTNEPPVGIVAMTAATSKEDEEECMRSGFTLYLPKPVKFAALKELVERKRLEKCKTLELKEVRQQNDAIPASAECHDEKPPSTC